MSDAVYVTPIEERVEVSVEQVQVGVTFEETTVIVTPPTQTSPTLVEVHVHDENVEVIKTFTEVVVEPDDTVVIVTPGGEPGPPGPPGEGQIWGPPQIVSAANLTQLTDDCSNYIECDCTLGNQEIRLPSHVEWLGKAIRLVRTIAGSNMVLISATSGISGRAWEMAYLGECIEAVAQPSGWWIQ